MKLDIEEQLTNHLLDNAPSKNPRRVELLALGQDECDADDGCNDNADC